MIEPSDHQCVGSRDAASNAGEVLANEYALAGTGRASFTWPCTPTGPCVGVRGPSPGGDVCAVRLRAQPEVERKLRGRFKCYVAVGSFFVQQGPRTNTGAHHTHVHTHLGCSIAV